MDIDPEKKLIHFTPQERDILGQPFFELVEPLDRAGDIEQRAIERTNYVKDFDFSMYPQGTLRNDAAQHLALVTNALARMRAELEPHISYEDGQVATGAEQFLASLEDEG